VVGLVAVEQNENFELPFHVRGRSEAESRLVTQRTESARPGLSIPWEHLKASQTGCVDFASDMTGYLGPLKFAGEKDNSSPVS